MSEIPTRSDVPWGSRTVQIVLLSTALAPLGVPLISPALPVFRDTFGVTGTQASLLVSGYFVVGIVLSPFVGVLADRIGRKRVLVAGLGTFGLLGGAIAFAPSFEVVLALQVIQGTGAAAIFITTVTIIGDTFEGPQRTAVLGVNIAVLSATAALFPVLGGFLVTLAWFAPFLTYFVAILAAVFVFVSLEEPVRTSPGHGVTYLRDALVAITTLPTIALFGVTFLTEFLAFGVIFTALPFLLEPVLTPVLVGGVILAAEATSMVAASSTGRLARKVSSLQMIAIGFACYGVGFLMFGVTTVIWAVVIAALFLGAGIGLPRDRMGRCRALGDGEGSTRSSRESCIPMSQHQSDDVAIDPIPITLEQTHTSEVDVEDVPAEIHSLTEALASTQPPTNPLVVLKTARWWYVHGKGEADPAFRWAIEWTRHLATDTPSDVDRFDAFLEYLVTVGIADETAELR